jgi:hypothetical protein
VNIEAIKAKIKATEYYYSHHAEVERKADDLTFLQIEAAILNSKILEEYPDTGRGESCLLVGFAGEIPIHAVCGWRGDQLVLITVYIPRLPKFKDPWTRGA